MGHDSRHPLLHLINEFEAQIGKFDLGSLDIDVILESRRKLYTIISQFNYTLNVKAPINKLVPDVLLNIFTLAADYDHTSRYYKSTRTPLVISRVCQHWRKCAVGWPALWRFIDIHDSRKIIELFLRRSKDTPLDLSIKEDALTSETGQKLNMKSCANRLCRLNLQINPNKLIDTQRFFHYPELQPLQLQHLKIETYTTPTAIPFLMTDIFHLDLSCLQTLYLKGINLPSVKSLSHNVLTQFIFHSPDSPILSQLLLFLSGCHLLRELELHITFSSEPVVATETYPLMIKILDFPQLNRLVLHMRPKNHNISGSILCLNYLQELSACIGTMGQLSHFSLYYYEFRWIDTIIPPSSVFRLVPPKTLDHFSDPVRLVFLANAEYTMFNLCPERNLLNLWTRSLTLYGLHSYIQIDRPILEMIHATPMIRHLGTDCATFRLLTLCVDLYDVFPHLNTLELIDADKIQDIIEILPPKLQTLILIRPVMSPQVLLDAVSRTGVEVLRLGPVENGPELEEITSTMHQIGVRVVRITLVQP